MIGEDFHYNNFWLSDYHMKMCSPNEAPQFAGRELDRSELSSVRSIPNHYSAHYSDTLTLSFLIVRDICLYPGKGQPKLSGSDIHNLRSWLESPRQPEPLFVLPYDGTDTWYFGIFTDIQPFMVGPDCFGLSLTFTCNAPFGFSSVVSNTYEIDSRIGDISGSFFNGSSEQTEYLRPLIRISSKDRFQSAEKLRITNLTDNGRAMELTMPAGLAELIIDCRKKCITDEEGRLVALNEVGLSVPNASDSGYISAETFLFYWLRLAFGENRLVFSMPNPNTISGIEISTRYIVKSGGF